MVPLLSRYFSPQKLVYLILWENGRGKKLQSIHNSCRSKQENEVDKTHLFLPIVCKGLSGPPTKWTGVLAHVGNEKEA
jgi:hypothetical protein